MVAHEGEIRPVALDQQLPLGMFAEVRYEIQRFGLEPGDRLLVVSDGVHDAAPGGRPRFRESGLMSALRRTRPQSAPEAVGTVMRSLRDHHAGEDSADDAVTVCLDRRR
jgi:serine phosphatase RsbU (regulator of sigma subunit)